MSETILIERAPDAVVRADEGPVPVYVGGADTAMSAAWAALAKNSADASATSAAESASSATAAQTAEAGAEAAEAGTLAAIAGAGGSLGDVTLEAASLAILAALDTSLGLTAVLTAPKLAGPFNFMTSAEINALYALTGVAAVTADPATGWFVPPDVSTGLATDGSAGAWVRQSDYVHPWQFGAVGDGPTDDTLALFRAAYVARLLKKPLISFRTPVWGIAFNVWEIGSVDGATQLGAGVMDNFRMTGDWRFRLKANSQGIIRFRNSKNIQLPDYCDVDIVTEATRGGGQFSLFGCSGVRGGRLQKKGTAVAMAAYTAAAGSILSCNQGLGGVGCSDVFVDSPIVEYASSSASSIFVVGGEKIYWRYARCVAGQDGVDVSCVKDWGGEVIDAVGCQEALDAGNAPYGHIGKIVHRNGHDGVIAKTEVGGTFSEGTHSLTIDVIELIDCDGSPFRHSAGASAGLAEADQQVLHNCHVGRIVQKTGVATVNSRCIFLVAGDKSTDPTRGFYLGSADVDANLGTTVEISGVVYDRDINGIVSNMPVAWTEGVGAATVKERFGGQVTNCRLTGDLLTISRGVEWIDVVTSGGKFRASEPRHCKFVRCGSRDSQTLGITAEFTSAGNKDVDFIDCFAYRCGLGGAADQYALSLWSTGATFAVTGIRITGGFRMEDYQRNLAFTSGGTVTPVVGQRVVGNTSGAAGFITKVSHTSGTWAGGDEAGTLKLRGVTGEFSAAETLSLYDEDITAAAGLRSADIATATGASTLAATSSGLRIQNLTTDECRLEGISASPAITNHLAWGFQGANSYNDPGNRLLPPVVSRSGATPLSMLYANRVIQQTAGMATTLSDAGGFLPPLGTEFIIQARGSNCAVAAGGGAAINSRSGLLTVPNGGEARLRITGHGPLTAALTGDLV